MARPIYVIIKQTKPTIEPIANFLGGKPLIFFINISNPNMTHVITEKINLVL